LLFFYRHDTIMGNIVFRILSLMHLMEIYIHLEAPVMLVRYSFCHMFQWQVLAFALTCSILACWIEVFVLNYVLWRHRPDIMVSFKTCLLWPFYHMFLLVSFWYAHWRCLCWYIPFFPMRHGLYTEGVMTPHLLQHIHGIETDPREDTSGESSVGSNGRLEEAGMEEGCTGMAGMASPPGSRSSGDEVDISERGALLGGASPDSKAKWAWPEYKHGARSAHAARSDGTPLLGSGARRT
jgi:hypothetical protein